MAGIRRSSFFKMVLVISACSAFMAGLVYYFSREKVIIHDFSPMRDTKPILNIFDKDWYWLVASSRQEYSPAFTLKYRTPDKDPKNFGKLIIKVLRDDDKFAGFSAYYKISFYEGKLLFVATDQAFRGKGYGEKLTRHAINDLFKRGCKVVKLVTRTNNIKARNLYKKIGFTETYVGEGFVYFAIHKK